MERVGDIGRRGLAPAARVVVDGCGYGIAALLAGFAAARGGKAVHPHGVVHEARLFVDGAQCAPLGSALLDTPAEHVAIMRFSRSLGLPRPVPDLLGVSLRVIDAYGTDRHQDVLMVSSVDRPVLHHGFVPASDVQQLARRFPIGLGAGSSCSASCRTRRRRGRGAETSSTGSLGRRRAGACALAWQSLR